MTRTNTNHRQQGVTCRVTLGQTQTKLTWSPPFHLSLPPPSSFPRPRFSHTSLICPPRSSLLTCLLVRAGVPSEDQTQTGTIEKRSVSGLDLGCFKLVNKHHLVYGVITLDGHTNPKTILNCIICISKDIHTHTHIFCVNITI